MPSRTGHQTLNGLRGRESTLQGSRLLRTEYMAGCEQCRGMPSGSCLAALTCRGSCGWRDRSATLMNGVSAHTSDIPKKETRTQAIFLTMYSSAALLGCPRYTYFWLHISMLWRLPQSGVVAQPLRSPRHTSTIEERSPAVCANVCGRGTRREHRAQTSRDASKRCEQSRSRYGRCQSLLATPVACFSAPSKGWALSPAPGGRSWHTGPRNTARNPPSLPLCAKRSRQMSVTSKRQEKKWREIAMRSRDAVRASLVTLTLRKLNRFFKDGRGGHPATG